MVDLTASDVYGSARRTTARVGRPPKSVISPGYYLSLASFSPSPFFLTLLPSPPLPSRRSIDGRPSTRCRQEEAGPGGGPARRTVPAAVQKAHAERAQVPPAVPRQGHAVRRGHCHQEPGTVRYGTVRCGTVRCGTVRYGAVRYGTVRCGTVRCGAVARWLRTWVGGSC